jgi:chromosome segregation ATPase
MKKFALLVAVVVALAAVSIKGFKVRAEVAKDKVLNKIDSVLDSMEVKRKDIAHSVIALKDGLVGLRRAKIKAQVESDQLERRVEPVQNQMAAIDSTLKTLRVHLASNAPVEVAGKMRNPDELNQMAQTLIQKRKECAGQLGGFRTAQDRLQKVAATLERKQSEYEHRLSGVESQLAVIDSNRIALKAMKDAAATMDSSEQSLAQNVAQLEEKVNGLYAQVEVELAGEDAQWSDAATRQEVQSVETILATVRTPKDTVNEIDSILVPSKAVAAAKK